MTSLTILVCYQKSIPGWGYRGEALSSNSSSNSDSLLEENNWPSSQVIPRPMNSSLCP